MSLEEILNKSLKSLMTIRLKIFLNRQRKRRELSWSRTTLKRGNSQQEAANEDKNL